MSQNDQSATTISSVYNELISRQPAEEIEGSVLTIVSQLKHFGKEATEYLDRRLRGADSQELEKLFIILPVIDQPELEKPLEYLVRERNVPLDIKIRVFEVMSELGYSLDDDFLKHLHAAEELYVQLGSYLKSAGEDDYARALSLKEEFFALPQSLKLAILIEMEQEYGERSDGFLLNITGEDAALDTEIIGRLSKRESVSAATILSRIADTSEQKNTVKAAKRALYVLKEKGIEPEAEQEEETADDQTPVTLEEAENPDRAYASSFDSYGGRLLLLTTPAMNRILVCQASIDEHKGLVQFNVSEMPRKRFRDFFKDLKERIASRAHSSIGEIDADHCRWLLHRAYQRCSDAGQLVPSEFKSLRYRIKPRKDHDAQAFYDQHLQPDKSKLMLYAKNADDIFAIQEVGTWIIQKEMLFPYVKRYIDLAESKLIVNEEQRQEQLDEAVRKYAGEYFTDERIAALMHRLRETSLVLAGQNRMDDAAAVASLAQSIDKHADIGPHPFFISFMLRSIIGAIHAITQQHAQQQQSGEEPADDQGPSIIT